MCLEDMILNITIPQLEPRSNNIKVESMMKDVKRGMC